jgi:hypothetical protein
VVSKVSQSDFGGGLWRSGARDRVPENASNELQELLLGEDGLPFERGGATRKSNAALGSAGLLWVASVNLPAGERTLFGSASAVDVLGVDDATPGAVPATVGGSPYTIAAPSAPFRPVVVSGWVLLWGAGANSVQWWAGSRRATGTGYSTGVVDVTHGSKTVVGTGTAWLANVQAGDTLSSGAVQNVVASVESNTSLTLVEPWFGVTTAGAGYSVAGALVSIPTLLSAVYGSRIQASLAGRWIVASGNTVYFTPKSEPPGYVVEFQDDDSHIFPASVRGLGVLRDVLMVFTGAGVYAISNMAYNLADVSGNPQQRVELVNADLIVWAHEGIAPWSGALVVPARDGIWLFDSVSSPQKISLSIDDLYLSYVNAGYKPGVAEVFNGHYFLPILNSSNVWQATLMCRLTQTRSGPPFAWTRLAGGDAQVAGYAERTATPSLLAASTQSSSRVLDCTSFFAPAAGVKLDADGSTRQAVWESREFALNDMPTTVRRVRVWYELTNPGSGTPTVEFAYAKDSDTSYTVVSNSLGTYQGTGIIAGWENDGTLYNQWPVNKRARGMRFRLRTTGDNAGFKIRQVELVTEQVQNQ